MTETREGDSLQINVLTYEIRVIHKNVSTG